MLVPDEIRKSVIFVGYVLNNKFKFAGTAFFVGVPSSENSGSTYIYVVSAKHVIAGASRRGIGGNIWLRLNGKDGTAKYIETPRDHWMDHPTDSSVDASVLAWAPPIDQIDYVSLPKLMTVTPELIAKENIGVGDEVFLTGLFVNHHGEKRNLPIIRIGNIALMPEERIATKDFGLIEAYLVEARSIGGLSGSPVFVNTSGIRRNVISVGGRKFYWLGLMHGHWDLPIEKSDSKFEFEDTTDKEAVNMGIAIVIPATQIMEIINQKIFNVKREK